MEAPNRPSVFNPSSKTYWVATVVATSGTLLLLRYEGYGENRSADFWCELTKGDLHPIGWCARSGHILQPPDSKLCLMGKQISLYIHGIFQSWIFIFCLLSKLKVLKGVVISMRFVIYVLGIKLGSGTLPLGLLPWLHTKIL